MLTRLSAHVGRKLLNTITGFQKVTECKFSRLAHNSINGPLRQSLVFNVHQHSKVYGIYLVRCESTANTTVNETVPDTLAVDVNSAVPKENLISEIPDPPVPVIEEITEAIKVHVNGEVTFESIGLGGYSPVGLIQSYFEWLHISFELPWWATIITTCVIVKVLTFPLSVETQKNAGRMQNILPEILVIQQKLTEAREIRDEQEVALYSYKLHQFFQKNKLKLYPWTNVLRFGVQIPIFIALRQMVNTPVESLKEGGLWWFKDLTACDPYYLLPLCSSITMYLVAEYTMASPNINMTSMMRYVVRGIPFVSFLFAMNFQGAILCHWVTSNFMTLIQNEILKNKAVKIYFNIPLSIDHKIDMTVFKKKKKFNEAISESWSNMKVSNKYVTQARADTLQFNKAGKAPLVKTYKNNPLQLPNETPTSQMSTMKK